MPSGHMLVDSTRTGCSTATHMPHATVTIAAQQWLISKTFSSSLDSHVLIAWLATADG
jgi:hypothetical protein